MLAALNCHLAVFSLKRSESKRRNTMNFDMRNVYTAVNADELHKGDLVFAADILSWLKTEVKGAEEEYDPMPIAAIMPEEVEYRFSVGEVNTVGYALAYLVCPARNAEAYRVWRKGKCIKEIGLGIDEWAIRNPKEHRVLDDEWFTREFRPVLEQAPASPQYRPYKSVDEFISDFNERFDRHTPACAMPLIWVKKVCGAVNKTKLIIAFYKTENLVSLDGEIYDMDGLYKDYTFLDGTPCGVQE